MTRPVIARPISTRRPSGPLSRHIGHYWLSLNNSAPIYTALPDGCVDLVFEITDGDCRAWAYGSTTRPTDIPCSPGTHYFGIQFRPGHSRHFIDAAAHEITDRREDLQALMQFPTGLIAAQVASDTLFEQLDLLLTAWLSKSPPVTSYIDHIVQHVDAHHGLLRVDDVAAQFGKSRRQVERAFLQTVGVPLKLFCMISRLHHAADLIVQPSSRSLTAVASEAGYSDQAHMTRDFTRLAGVSPGRLSTDVAFLQYRAARGSHAGASASLGA